MAAVTKELGTVLHDTIVKAAKYYNTMGHGSFAPGNADGGLTTIEEKSMGAYSKGGHSSIAGLLKPGDIPPHGGLYLLDVVPDGEPMFGFPNINDNAEISELMACGCHIILFTTGRGSIVGSAISPVIKICANPETYARMKDDMDINAGKILLNEATLENIANEIIAKIADVANGATTCSEDLGHREFVLSYKRFEPAGPACLP
jgi:altronate dehydratase large subunit